MIDELELWDYRRATTEIYREVRESSDPSNAWETWRVSRDVLFATHPQSPLPPRFRARFGGLDYYAYDPAWRLHARISAVEPETRDLPHSGGGGTTYRRFGTASLSTPGGHATLTLFWLDAYGGGVFLPFRDATNGTETYGGGRYLLDTVKGADLGHAGDEVVLDFNFAYHPSCVHDTRWSCPLSPRENTLGFGVTAGERLRRSAAPAEGFGGPTG